MIPALLEFAPDTGLHLSFTIAEVLRRSNDMNNDDRINQEEEEQEVIAEGAD